MRERHLQSRHNTPSDGCPIPSSLISYRWAFTRNPMSSHKCKYFPTLQRHLKSQLNNWNFWINTYKYWKISWCPVPNSSSVKLTTFSFPMSSMKSGLTCFLIHSIHSWRRGFCVSWSGILITKYWISCWLTNLAFF